MKKNKKKNSLIISVIVLAIALFCTIFKIDVLSYLDEISIDSINNNSIKTIDSTSSDKETVEFVKCVDGDTATLKIDGKNKKVRFLGIDTPESVHPYKEVEKYGKDASEYTCNLLKNANKIELSYEENLSKTDKYGRILAWVFADNELVQEKLLKIGYAEVKYIYAKYSKLDTLYQAQNEAKKQKLGLWYEYEETKYNDKTYIVTFKVSNKEEKVTVQEGELVDIINNPTKNGYVFAGWTYSSQPYDLSKPITRNITVKAKFTKK